MEESSKINENEKKYADEFESDEIKKTMSELENRNDITKISIRLLKYFQKNVMHPIKFKDLIQDRYFDIFLSIQNNERQRARLLRKAIKILNQEGLRITKKNEENFKTTKNDGSKTTKNDGFKIIKNSKTYTYEGSDYEMECFYLLYYIFYKSGLYSCPPFYSSHHSYLFNFANSNFSKYIYTEYTKLKDDILNAPKIFYSILKAISEKKDLRIKIYNRKIDNQVMQPYSYRPLGLIFDDDRFYLATFFQPKTNKNYLLDFISLSTIEKVEEIKRKAGRYATVKGYYRKFFQTDKIENFEEMADLELLGNLFRENLYFNHYCEIQYYESCTFEKLKETFSLVTISESCSEYKYKNKMQTKLFSTVTYDNKEDIFEWVYNEKENDNIVFSSYNMRKEYADYTAKKERNLTSLKKEGESDNL